MSSSAGLVRDNSLGVSVGEEGEVRRLLGGEGRAATQRHPMNIWSSAADCVWALSTHNVSFGGHLTSKRWTIRRNSHNSSGSAVAVQLFQQIDAVLSHCTGSHTEHGSIIIFQEDG